MQDSELDQPMADETFLLKIKIYLSKWRGFVTLNRVISVAASLSNNVNTSKSITLLVHYRSPLQFQTCRLVNKNNQFK